MMRTDPTRRRLLCAMLCAIPAGRTTGASPGVEHAAVSSISRGNCVVLIRHAETVAGIGDPPGMRLDDCSTQRNLSGQGRDQAARIGRWFRDRRLTPTHVRSSQWCRCLDTAREAFGSEIPTVPWPALNSFFQGQGDRGAQIREAAAMARSLAMRRSYGQFEVWVTHQVVISALTGYSPSMGEMVVAAYKAPAPDALVAEGSLRVLAAGIVP